MKLLARSIALGTLLDDWDGYLGGNNYRLYRHPKDGRFHLLPHGIDQTFRSDKRGLFAGTRGGKLAKVLFDTDAGSELYLAALKDIARRVFRPERWRARVAELWGQVRPAVISDVGRQGSVGEFDEEVLRFLGYFESRLRMTRWQLLALDDQDLDERLERMGGRGRRGFGF